MTITIFGSGAGADSGASSSVTIREDNPTTNYGNVDAVEAFNWAAGDTGHILIRFTGVAAVIPPGSTINSVTLSLYLVISSNSASAYEIRIYPSLRAWVEGQATWNIWSTGNNWATAGGSGSGTDIAASYSQALVIGDSVVDAYYDWASNAALIADVKAAIDAGQEPAWYLARTDATSSATRQWVSEEGLTNFRPKLTVDWTSAQIKAPTSDISAGSWAPSSGATLFETIDESSASDTDFDRLEQASAPSTFEVKFASATDPVSNTGHILRYRLRGNGSLVVSLMQGGTTIASWTHNPAPSDYTTFEQTLTGGQADAISDYSDLRIRVAAS